MKVKKDPDKQGLFLVESASSAGKFYSVDPKKPSCTCPAYRFRGRGMCKHIEAVRNDMEKKNMGAFEEVLAHVKKEGEVDAVELIERFGEEAVDELVRRGDLLEKKGLIRLMD